MLGFISVVLFIVSLHSNTVVTKTNTLIKRETVAHSCNPSTWGGREGRFVCIGGQLDLSNLWEISEKPCLKTEWLSKDPWHWHLSGLHTHLYLLIYHTCIHTHIKPCVCVRACVHMYVCIACIWVCWYACLCVQKPEQDTGCLASPLSIFPET